LLSLLKNKYSRLSIIAGLIVILDQVTKVIVLKTIPIYDSIQVIDRFFYITHIHNPGGAFGFLATQSPLVRNLLFIFASLLALVLLIYFYLNTPDKQPLISLGFSIILGGAVGNLIDRIRFGEVVDFLVFYITPLPWEIFNPWPAFNVADSAITIGVIIFIFHLLFVEMQE